MLRVVACLCLVAAVASAEDAPNRLDVAVGETVEREVGYAIGFRCDDASLIDVAMKAKTPQSNVFVVKGLKEGTTLCRVGTQSYGPSYLYEIRVTPAKPRRR